LPQAGQGAAFTVELPLLVTHHPESRPTVGLEPAHLTGDESGRLSSPPRLNGLRVLVVDDEQDARELLSTVLTRYGASVTAAETADEALERLPLVRPDVLVSDIEMPGRDGYSLIRAVRTTAPPELRSIPAIALTARARFSDRMSALTAGYQVHVPKPVEPAELITLIANLTHQNPGQEP
jgi:CheY-like chemotaxis protein